MPTIPLQNLGIKTIPFNNVTSYPYGSYNINVLEYNYIYNFCMSI